MSPVQTEKKSCHSCVFFSMSEDLAVCNKLLKVVVSTKLLDDNKEAIRSVWENTAERCDSFNERLVLSNVGLPTSTRYTIGVPTVEALDQLQRNERNANRDVLKRSVNSCTTCMFSEKNSDGTTGTICSARGEYITPKSFRKVAGPCQDKSIVETVNTASVRFGLNWFGELLGEQPADNGFNTPTPPLSVFPVQAADPSEYPTDKEITPEDEKNGIRAWRRISNPAVSKEASTHTFLPIFRADFFSPEDQAIIPKTGSDEHPELYRDHGGLVYDLAVMWQELDETPALWSEAGLGKTEMYRHLAWLMQLPFERFSITGRTELDDLAGRTEYTPEKGTFFTPGRLVRAWGKPCVICLDEPNTANAEVWQFLRPILDNSRQFVLDMNKGETIVRSDSTYLGMAMNPAWDMNNLGVDALADADVSRKSRPTIGPTTAFCGPLVFATPPTTRLRFAGILLPILKGL